MPPRKEREAALPAGRGEEVRDDEHERSPTDLTQCGLEELGQRRRWRALEPRAPLKQIDQAQHLHASAARRDDAFDALAVDDRADLVAVARKQPREDRDEVDEQVTLERGRRAEVHRRRDVQQEVRRDLAVLVVLADVGRVHARGHVPVDVPDVVAEHVFADVGEVEAVAAEHRAVVALKESVETTDDGPLEPAQPAVRRAQRRVPASARQARECVR